MKNRPYTEVVRLTGLLLDGEATPEQFGRLQKLIRESSVARFAYRATVNLHTALSLGRRGKPEEAGSGGETPLGSATLVSAPALSSSPNRTPSKIPWICIGVGTVAAFLIALTIFYKPSDSSEKLNGGIPVTILRADRAITYPNKPIHSGETISGRDINLAHGFIELELPDETVISLKGPARVIMKENFPILVKSGLVNFVRSGGESEMCVETSDSVLKTQGAHFGLDVDARGRETSVAVFRGKVDVTPPHASDSASENWTLHVGESSRFSKGRRIGKMPVVVKEEPTTYLLRASESSIISEILESPPENKESRSYMIVSGGMKERRSPFIDRPEVGWVPVNEKGFPRELQGADLVRTYQKDRWRKNFSLTLRFEKAAELFVLVDCRATPPSWLTKDYEKTGEQLRANPIEKSEAPFGVRYDIWKRTVGPGSVTLGRAYPIDQPTVSSMYGIAYKMIGNSVPTLVTEE